MQAGTTMPVAQATMLPATTSRGVVAFDLVENAGERSEKSTGPVFRLDQHLIITIDGPAASGKSATAKLLAQELGMQVLSTGAMYRCATALALEHGVAFDHEKRLLEVVRAARMHFNWKTSPPDIIAEGRSYSRRIMDEDVTAHVSRCSDIVPLRQLMVGMQREVAAAHPRLVSEGRDQGSVVFPDAAVKFYLHASPLVRAQRRREQLAKDKGIERDVEELRREIEERDERDMHKPYGALCKPDGAYDVESSDLTLAQVVDRMKTVVLALARKPAPSEAGS